eukprot:PITA_16592
MGKCVMTDPSYFKEVLQHLIWVDAMVEEYDSVLHNSVWHVVPRPEDKLVKEVYIEQLEGFETFDHELHLCRLKKALYGLKQEPRVWYTKIDNYFTTLGFTKSEADANLYHIVVGDKILIIVLYVDDLIVTNDNQLIKPCKEDLAKEFEVKDMGLMHYFLGMEVWHRDEELFVSQGRYANEILKRFHMERNKPMETPLAGNWRKEDATSGKVVEDIIYRQLVGSLMYLVNM